MSRWARRVDTAQPPMVEELRANGCSVILTHAVGGKAPDFIAGRHGATVLVEAKTPGRERKEKARLVRQADARDEWRGGPYIQATTTAQVLAALDAARPLA